MRNPLRRRRPRSETTSVYRSASAALLVLVASSAAQSWLLFRVDQRAESLSATVADQAVTIDRLSASVDSLAQSTDRQSRAIAAAADTLHELQGLDAYIRSHLPVPVPPTATTAPGRQAPPTTAPGRPTTTTAPTRASQPSSAPGPVTGRRCVSLIVLELCG